MTAPNVLVVTVDCLRRDRVSAYGYARATTPVLDGLIETGLHASFAHAAAPWTAPSVASLFTGVYPYGHGAGAITGDPKNLSSASLPTALPEGVPILQELLSGYASAAFLSVWNAALPFGTRLGHLATIERPAPQVATRALRWIDAQASPWCCWVHLREPHDPLEVPRELRAIFGDTGSYRTTRRWRFTERTDDVTTARFALYRDRRERLYDAAVASADHAIGELLSRIPANTIVVVTADHGEEMWEHREDEIASLPDPRGLAGVGHGHAMWQDLLLVPLVIVGLDGQPAGEISTPTSLVDVLPTILHALGQPVPETDGVSLLGPPTAGRVVFAEGIAYGPEQRAAIDVTHSLIAANGFERLSTLDPTTHREVRTAPGDSPSREKLSAAIAARPASPSADGVSVAVTAEMERHLRSLGYLE